MALLTHDSWANAVSGKYVDIDGAHGGQCWDTFADYCISVLGIKPINTYGGNWNGWAYAIWDQYEVNGAKNHFDKISPDQPARRGDTVIWTDKHWYYPASHIAIVEHDAGTNVLCVSQNSSPAQPWLPGYSTSATGPNIRQSLTKAGLAGYLRPKTNFQPVGNINPSNEQDAPMSQAELNQIQAMHDVTRKFLIDSTQAQQDVTRAHLINATQKQHDVTRAHIINKVSGATQAQEDVTRQYLSDRIAEGAKPADVADSVIAALGTDLAGQVVQELATRLTDLGVTK